MERTHTYTPMIDVQPDFHSTPHFPLYAQTRFNKKKT
jgi:hypothetical protein